MRGLLPGSELLPLPDVSEAQRKASRTAFNVISVGSSLQRESLTVARTATHLPLNTVERTTGTDVSDARSTVESRFDAAQEVSDRAEDRFLTTMLSTSQLTAEYAELIDRSVDRACRGEASAPK
jgi:hypothetical protein